MGNFSRSEVARNYCRWKADSDSPEFGALLLDAHLDLIRFDSFPRKSGQPSHQLQKDVVNSVLAVNAVAVILMQNYPSGPGDDIIQRLTSSLALIGVRVLDHIIVNKPESISLRERGLLGQDEEGNEMIGKSSDYTTDDASDTLKALRELPCCLPFSHPDYEPPSPEQVDALIRVMGWSQSDAARIVGVACDAKKGSTTLRKWRASRDSAEHREIPYAAWRLLLIHAEIARENGSA